MTQAKRNTIGILLGLTMIVVAVTVTRAVDSPQVVAVMWTVMLIGVLGLLRIIRGPLESPTHNRLPVLVKTTSKRVQRGLAPSEKLLWEFREHPLSMWKWMLGGIVLLLVVFRIASTGDAKQAITLFVIGAAIIAIRLWFWDRHRLCLTDKRLMSVRGIFSTTYRTMPLSKLTDQTAHMPAISNILAWLRIIKTQFATVIVESAGQDQALSRIVFVPHGHMFNRVLMDLVFD